MFGLPSLQTIIVASVLPVLIAFGIVNYRQTWYSVATFFFVCVNTWFAVSSYMTFMYKSWSDGTEKPQVEKPVVKQFLDMNKADGYTLTTASIKMDYIRLFNRTLLDQRNGNLEVNMTENFWLKKFEGMEESRWIKIGGKGRADFIDMLERGIKFGAYKEIGGKGKRVPDDWQKIRRLEKGEPLPQ